ncbi:MAG: hypothetical protein IJR00_10235 [Lachnospiraceae bacterium]|nr:hypothetical protein [Lachnospiraceae bacterium]
MALMTLTKGMPLHAAQSEQVKTLEVILKGTVMIDSPNFTLHAGPGAILGLAEKPGEGYRFNYKAEADAQVMQYPYESRDDLLRIIQANQKIAPLLAAEAVRLACEALNVREQKLDYNHTTYNRIMDDLALYPELCQSLGEYPQSFESVQHLQPPSHEDGISDWECATMRALLQHADTLRKNCYSLSPDIAVGFILMTIRYYEAVTKACELSRAYEQDLKRQSADFTSAVQLVRARIAEHEQGFEGDENHAGVIENALDTILSFSAADPEVTEQFREGILAFRENTNRYATTDDARTTRRALGKLFYEIYFAAFLRSMDAPDKIPAAVKMLFQFGFVDEVLAGEENTSMLHSMISAYQPDPAGKVLTAYEWLKMIYEMKVEPSKNEFDQDYPTWLREQKTSGEIKEEQMNKLLTDGKSRFFFEAKNFFTIGGRVTFGHAASFVPFFDKLNVTRPLAKAYVTTESVNSVFSRIRGVDFGLFSRQRSYFNPAIGVNQLFLNEVIMPYVVLTPIIGCRGSLWQEIEGKDRGTPARMLLPVFHTEDLDACLLQLAGDFRWEMCKTEQGVHWNDVSDPSLTALYCDYLQFFKKNRQLSEENKEKLKTALKRYSNDFKKVFIADYMTYVNYEAAESPRLNKVAREVLFTFCPFPKEMREKMADNPQYRDLIKKYDTQQQGKLRPLAGLINKLKKENIEVPEELIKQYQVLQA